MAINAQYPLKTLLHEMHTYTKVSGTPHPIPHRVLMLMKAEGVIFIFNTRFLYLQQIQKSSVETAYILKPNKSVTNPIF